VTANGVSGLGSLLWFIAILAAIPVVLWLLKRSPIGGAGTPGLLRSVAALPLSTSQRIVTIEVGQGEERRWLVLGVTAHSITTLHSMAPQGDAPTGTVPPLPFKALLDKLRPTQGGPHGD